MGFMGALFGAGRGLGYHLGIQGGNESGGRVVSYFEIHRPVLIVWQSWCINSIADGNIEGKCRFHCVSSPQIKWTASQKRGAVVRYT